MQLACALMLPVRRAVRRRAADAGAGRATDRSETAAAKHWDPAEDQAFYSCACGYAFREDVSTSVRCPHCGAEHAW